MVTEHETLSPISIAERPAQVPSADDAKLEQSASEDHSPTIEPIFTSVRYPIFIPEGAEPGMMLEVLLPAPWGEQVQVQFPVPGNAIGGEMMELDVKIPMSPAQAQAVAKIKQDIKIERDRQMHAVAKMEMDRQMHAVAKMEMDRQVHVKSGEISEETRRIHELWQKTGSYHPGGFTKGRWDCCLGKNVDWEGCKRGEGRHHGRVITTVTETVSGYHKRTHHVPGWYGNDPQGCMMACCFHCCVPRKIRRQTADQPPCCALSEGWHDCYCAYGFFSNGNRSSDGCLQGMHPDPFSIGFHK